MVSLRCLARRHSWFVVNVAWTGMAHERVFDHATCRCRRCRKHDVVHDEATYRRRMGGFYESLRPTLRARRDV